MNNDRKLGILKFYRCCDCREIEKLPFLIQCKNLNFSKPGAVLKFSCTFAPKRYLWYSNEIVFIFNCRFSFCQFRFCFPDLDQIRSYLISNYDFRFFQIPDLEYFQILMPLYSGFDILIVF